MCVLLSLFIAWLFFSLCVFIGLPILNKKIQGPLISFYGFRTISTSSLNHSNHFNFVSNTDEDRKKVTLVKLGAEYLRRLGFLFTTAIATNRTRGGSTLWKETRLENWLRERRSDTAAPPHTFASAAIFPVNCSGNAAGKKKGGKGIEGIVANLTETSSDAVGPLRWE